MPDPGLSVQVKDLNTFEVVPSSLGSSSIQCLGLNGGPPAAAGFSPAPHPARFEEDRTGFHRFAAERRGNDSKIIEDFSLQAKAGILTV